MPLKIDNGIDLQNQRAQNMGSPSVGTDGANKNYVDNALYGLDWKEAVRVATTGNITLSATQTVDGVALAVGDRVLVKDQTAGSGNGLYLVASGAWTRTVDADQDSEVTAGLTVSVMEGTVNGDKAFNLVTNNPIVVGTTALTFSLIAGGTQKTYVAGNGLTENPSGTFNVGQGTGILVAGTTVSIDPSVVAQSKSFNVGDGSATTVTLTHNFGTRDVSVVTYTNSGSFEDRIPDVQRPSINSITLVYATAPAASAIRAKVST